MTEPRSRRDAGFGTRAIEAATRAPEIHQEPGMVPIYQTVTFNAHDSTELGDILADRQPGYAYSRIDNPTSQAVGDAVAEMHGAPAGFAFASGMAAAHAMFVSLLQAGDHVIAANAIYGSVHKLLDKVLTRLGIEVSFVDITDVDALRAAFRPNTRVVHVESIANPNLIVTDTQAVAEIAHRHGAVLTVDNTFASPYLCRPLELGADLVMDSCTKWISGHSDVLGGTVVGSPELIRSVRSVQVDTGGSLAPFSAFLVLRGITTLHVRMERHSSNALALARALEGRDIVRQVLYPGLPSHPQFNVAQRVLRAGGGMLAFDLGDRLAAGAFIDALTVPVRTASLGSVMTIAVHPPSTTHRQLDEAALAAAGIREGLVRVSVGLEDIDDLLTDFEHGLNAARTTATTRSA
ncbi:MAG TPA: aminotransferase class I/II-fold pyridoxal phosphate-dependent enzyme [Candidatus Limnocylindrales bacterium]|nr:aminotransferase class I/II-fold pyridoxal phosphate-dependent enzyme [Candidatus Limnocylindrales bacterium]